MAFKMKGSPMKRNFGVGSPIKQEEEETIKETYEGGVLPEVTVSGGEKPSFWQMYLSTLKRFPKMTYDRFREFIMKQKDNPKTYTGGSERHKLTHPSDK